VKSFSPYSSSDLGDVPDLTPGWELSGRHSPTCVCDQGKREVGAYSLATISTAPEYTGHFPLLPPLVVGTSRDVSTPIGEGLRGLLGMYESDEESDVPSPVAATNTDDPPGPLEEESLAAAERADAGDHGSDPQPMAIEAGASHP